MDRQYCHHGICGRQGLGKLRHVDTHCLWIQQRVWDRSIELVKVRGEENPANLFTKHLVGQDRSHSLLTLFGCCYADGRPASVPQLMAGAGTSNGELLVLKGAAAVDWHGQLFAAVEHGGILLPEAYENQHGFLLHLHGDHETRYPRAFVDHEPCDQEPEDSAVLEQRGVVLGQRALRPLARAPAQLSAAQLPPGPLQLPKEQRRSAFTITGRSTAYKA